MASPGDGDTLSPHILELSVASIRYVEQTVCVRVAGFAEKRIQAGRRHNPKQQQFAIWVSEPVPRVLRNKYRSALLDRMTYIVQYESKM
jgi:hypothetical protein